MPGALVRKHRLIQVVIAVRQAPTAGGRRRTTLLAPLSAHPRVHHTRWTSAGPITWIRRCDITHARHTLRPCPTSSSWAGARRAPSSPPASAKTRRAPSCCSRPAPRRASTATLDSSISRRRFATAPTSRSRVACSSIGSCSSGGAPSESSPPTASRSPRRGCSGRVRVDSTPGRRTVPRDDVAAVLARLLHDERAAHRVLYVDDGDQPLDHAVEAVLSC